MSNRSEKRSTIFPFPSSPHWAPKITTLLISSFQLSTLGPQAPKPTIVPHCATLTFYAIDGCFCVAWGGWVRPAHARRFHGQAQDLPTLRPLQDPYSPDQAEFRDFTKSRATAMGPVCGKRRGVCARPFPSRAGQPPGHDCRGVEFLGNSSRRRLFRQRPGCHTPP